MTDNILLKLPTLEEIEAEFLKQPLNNSELNSVFAILLARIKLLDKQMSEINRMFDEFNLHFALLNASDLELSKRIEAIFPPVNLENDWKDSLLTRIE